MAEASPAMPRKPRATEPARERSSEGSAALADLQIVVVSHRPLTRLGLDSIPGVTRRTPELASRGVDSPDLYIVDVWDGTPISLIAQLARGGSQPLLVVGGSSTEEAVRSLDAGAADYVREGTVRSELFARASRVAQRTNRRVGRVPVTLGLGDLSISTERHELRKSGKLIALTPYEFALMQILLEAGGAVVTHRQLINGVWGAENRESRHILRLFIGQLREKLEADRRHPTLIMTEYRRGYRINLGTSPDDTGHNP